ncbi:serine/threonine-protein phosphatase 6 regulatory ankyrin repeat subunit A-like [Biomphalaria glabrata]|uniref:Serine/threonine-protein phosphatase 6 regulatory ankyrin repeat subunit A-like n=2 Tax=Biomphalaria glabrata TaxID=6526 RepID=A0A9U8E4Z8_BIOGL|nr:serine/threonine-protein phosphatase 6 regulatory ankyrin repeat subunit A-like [Biomphalaria glabrata]KAI8746594.1 ankyrin repeat and KH domain-containing protein 1 [Biomphalaria glabrata]
METKNAVQLNDTIFFKTIASGSIAKIHKLLRLCDQKTTHFSSHALNWAVFEACNIGYNHLLQFVLQDGTRLEIRDDNGNSPLMICSAKGFPGIVGKLLRLGADVNAKNSNGDTPLMLATSREVIELLLQNRRLHLDEQNSTGNTALMSAIETTHLQKVKLLINAGANPNRQVGECPQSSSFSLSGFLINNEGESAFDVSKRMGFGKLLEFLNRAKLVNLNPLQLAAVKNDFDSCITLLKYKLCDREETQNLRPDILCYVLKHIQQRDAILSSDIEFVRELCRLGMDVNRCQCCAKSLIELVLNIGSYKLAKILCAYGATVTHDDLVSAVKGQHLQMLQLLLNHGAPVNKYHHRGYVTYKDSALDAALESSFTSAASVLLDHGAELEADCAVTQALRSKNTKTLNFLLTECGEETRAEIATPETLIQAVKLGDIQLIQLLLDAGAYIDGVHDDKTPLMSAVHIEVIEFLLSKGADVNFTTSTTAIINALFGDYFNDINLTFRPKLNSNEMDQHIIHVIEVFLKNGANLEDNDYHGNTALIKSAQGSFSIEVLKYLLDKGADVNQKDCLGLTALHNAATESHKLDFVEVLLEYNVPVNLKSNEGLTPLHQAVRDVNTVRFFLENQANVNADDFYGDTPLSLASASHGDLWEVVQLLIASGSDINNRNTSGMSPVWLAAQNYNLKCLQLLIDAKADLGPNYQQKKSSLSIHGASVEFVKRDIIHRLIAAGSDGTLIQRLIKIGFCPTDILLKSTIFGWPKTSVSPLAVSLILDSVDIARFFIDNWYLTKSDINILSRNKKILSCSQLRETRALPYLEEVSRQPMRLELLCFITVSSALGSDRGRRQRILNSKLPVLFQDKLLFSKLEVKVLEAVAGGGIFFLYELKKNKILTC